MALDDILKKTRQLGGEFTAFIKKEHEIGISNERLQRHRERIVKALEEQGIQEPHLELVQERIRVTGRIAQGGGGRFNVELEPGGVTWEEGRHSLFFVIVKQDVQMDSRVANLLTTTTTRLCGALFGEHFLNRKLGIVDEQGRIEVSLDGQSRTLDAVVQSVRVTRLACKEGRLRVRFAPLPKEAAKNAKELLSWWLHKVRQGRREGQ